MVFEHIRKLQQEYMDKFVSVDEQRPELHRFKGRTGMVKTVNMSGRALVEFDGNENIGWYDIDIDYLKVIDQPLAADESAERAAPAAKTARKAAPKAAPAKTAPAKKTPAKAGDEKMAVDDILAAARGKASTAKTDKSPAADAATRAKSDARELSVADILDAVRKPKSANVTTSVAETMEAGRVKKNRLSEPKPFAKVDQKDMSVADILAAARGNAPVAKEASAPEPVPAPSASSDGSLPTEVAGMIAYCRRVDG